MIVKKLKRILKRVGLLENNRFIPYAENLIFSRTNIVPAKNVSIAVHISITNLELTDVIIENLSKIYFEYDLFICVNTESDKNYIASSFKNLNYNQLSINIYSKELNSLYCFFYQIKDIYNKYDYIIHINTDVSCVKFHQELNKSFVNHCYQHLLGSSENISFIINHFNSNPMVGMIYPPEFPIFHKLKSNDDSTSCNKMEIEKYVYPNMFWISRAVLQKFFVNKNFINKKFLKNESNITFYNKVNKKGFQLSHIYNNAITMKSNKSRIAFFAHFDKNNIISQSDFDYLLELRKISNVLCFITTSSISDIELLKIQNIVDKIIVRENKGFDFGSWKDGVIDFGFENLMNFDEVVIANNSCYAPVYPLENVFCIMERQNFNFWGMTMHPDVDEYIDWLDDKIYKHIQSYFVVFNKIVFSSEVFKKFWTEYNIDATFCETIKFGEIGLTRTLGKYFSFSSYVKTDFDNIETLLPNYCALIEPQVTLLLGSPLIKKKVFSEASLDNCIDLLNIIDKITQRDYYKNLKKLIYER